MAVPYTRTSTALSLIVNFTPTVIPSSHVNFAKLCELVTKPGTTEADIEPLLNIPKAISTFTGGNVTVVDGRLFFRGYEVKNTLAQIILGFVREGQPEAAKPFEMFMEKAFANPDPRAAEGLFDWIVAGKLPITPDGDILAWKAVQDDYFSIASGPRGKLRHMIDDVVEEPRHETDANPNQTCSRGIHFCSIEYLKSSGYASGGSRIMAVSISPTDVVAFPRDYNLSKGRCCKLTVVGEVPQDKVPEFYPNGQLIYNGWAKPAAPAPKTRFPVQVGDVWRTANGQTVTVDRITPDRTAVAWLSNRHAVFADDGTSHRTESKRNGNCLVELISEKQELAQQLDLKPGDRVRRRDGRVETVRGVSGDAAIVKTGPGDADCVYADVGLDYRVAVGKPVVSPRPQDVVEVISRAPRTPRNAHGFAVGQVWVDGHGDKETVVSINEAGEYPLLTDGGTYTASGAFLEDGRGSPDDLKRLIKDVD